MLGWTLENPGRLDGARWRYNALEMDQPIRERVPSIKKSVYSLNSRGLDRC